MGVYYLLLFCKDADFWILAPALPYPPTLPPPSHAGVTAAETGLPTLLPPSLQTATPGATWIKPSGHARDTAKTRALLNFFVPIYLHFFLPNKQTVKNCCHLIRHLLLGSHHSQRKKEITAFTLGDSLGELTCSSVLEESVQDALEMKGQDNDPLLSMQCVQEPVSNPPKPWYDKTHYFFLQQSHGGPSFAICLCIKR